MIDGFSLKGRIAVVTGGGSGIGAGIAAVLAEAGAYVVIADRDEAAAARAVAAIDEAGGAASPLAVDVADEESIVRACAALIASHGAPWLLVNNAGYQHRETLLEGTAAHWDRSHAVNARGPFLMTREIARAMVAAGRGGRVVNIASNSIEGPMIRGLAPYVAAKSALAGLTLGSAFELVAHGITVNTVLPGGVVTPGAIDAQGPAAEGPGRRMPPLGLCEPRDIGAAVLFFASPAAFRITNQRLTVDAGFSLT